MQWPEPSQRHFTVKVEACMLCLFETYGEASVGSWNMMESYEIVGATDH